jgi:hypothetical protein
VSQDILVLVNGKQNKIKVNGNVNDEVKDEHNGAIKSLAMAKEISAPLPRQQ